MLFRPNIYNLVISVAFFCFLSYYIILNKNVLLVGVTMVFSSLFFLFFFLPLNLGVYYLCKTTAARNTVMLVFSLIFYAWGEPKYVFLLVAMAFCDWFLARIMENSRRDKKRMRAALIAAVFGYEKTIMECGY